jgi:predicted acylesterase/phospholipase RssA
MSKNNIKVGFAFSGASSRSVFYMGFLEVLRENSFPVDYIAALSGATIVAASYACGTMDHVKKQVLNIDKEFIFSLFERSKGKGGLYNLNKLEEILRIYTHNKNFEDLETKLAFIATDINAGEEVVLQVGDIAKAICASCTLPGVFEPQVWGNKILVDGGIVNIVPGNVARDAGMDVVIGIDLRATRHVFSPWEIYARKLVNNLRALFLPKQVRNMFRNLSERLQNYEFWQNMFEHKEIRDQLQNPHMFKVIGRSLDLAIEAQKRDEEVKNFNCDLVITKDLQLPFWRRNVLLRFMNVDNTHLFYEEGRRAAEEYLPQFWQLLKDKELIQQHSEEQLKIIFSQTNS